jgi:hypothetical protein
VWSELRSDLTREGEDLAVSDFHEEAGRMWACLLSMPLELHERFSLLEGFNFTSEKAPLPVVRELMIKYMENPFERPRRRQG